MHEVADRMRYCKKNNALRHSIGVSAAVAGKTLVLVPRWKKAELRTDHEKEAWEIDGDNFAPNVDWKSTLSHKPNNPSESNKLLRGIGGIHSRP